MLDYILEYKHERLYFGSASIGLRAPRYEHPPARTIVEERTLEIEAETDEEAVQKAEDFCSSPTGQMGWQGMPEERALKNIPICLRKSVKRWD